VNTLTQIALVLAGCFAAYLLLLAVVVLRTGSTDGLAAVGAAVQAFITAIVALIRRWPSDTTTTAEQKTHRDDGPLAGTNEAP
jgi:hypothetical protein